MNERTAEATTVEEDGIRVEKSFTDDAFPVPAVTFDLSSHRDDAVRVRIVDRIPDAFPMDRVGFHPDYESENWTAYKDHRVEFERVLEPGESVETVFGIRDDDPDLDGFLATPIIEHVPVGEEIGDVLGTGETDAVREVLSGDRETLPGMEEEPLDEQAAEPEDGAEPDAVVPEPRTVADGTTAAVTPHETTEDEGTDADVDGVEAKETEDGEAEAEAAEVDETEAEETEDDDGAETTSAPEGDSVTTSETVGGVAAGLAEEIRSGEVDEDDMELLRAELDLGVPRSVDVRISRLQSNVSDIEAYADALAEFIDDEGTAREVLDGLDTRVDEVEATVDSLDTRLTAGERAHGELADDVESIEDDVTTVREDVDSAETTVAGLEETVSAVEATAHGLEATVQDVSGDVTSLEADLAGLDDALDDVGDDVETLYEEVDDAAAGVERADERIDDVEERFGRFEEEFDDLWDDLAEVDSRLTDVEGRLGDDLEDVEAELEAIDDHLEELEAFRQRLNEAFGP